MRNEFEDGWVQGHLLPPNAVELTLRIGVLAEAEHAQVQFEVFNPADKVLIAMESRPHFDPTMVFSEAVIFVTNAVREMQSCTGIDMGAPPALKLVEDQAEPNEPFPD